MAAAGVLAEANADASLNEVLAAALEANERLARLTEELRADNARLRAENEQLRAGNARLRERDAQREAQLERMAAELAVLKRMVFGRSSERSRPEPSGRWWLWAFIGPDIVCFVMDPTRAGAVLARHAGIGEETGQLTADKDGGPRSLVISSDFYSVYTSAGTKADGLVNLFCWAHIRRYFVRAGDANPDQLPYWTQAWLERIKVLYAAHEQLMGAWAQAAPGDAAAAAALEKAYQA